jgi:hypothetical protein
MPLVDRLFCQLDEKDSEYRKEPISQTKLKKQDAAWQDMKECLGWDYARASKHLLLAKH